MRLGYSPFGQVYRKHNDKTVWKINAGVNANKQLGQLMPYQYTGGYTDGNTGLVHLDARWYNPHTSCFVQPDYWNFKNTYLPAEIQHELMRFTGLNTSQLLRDPSQQLAYGYVSGNPLTWVDPLGLCGSWYENTWSAIVNADWKDITSSISTYSGYAATVSLGIAIYSGPTPLGAGALFVFGATQSVSMTTGSMSVGIDIIDGGEFNESNAASQGNNVVLGSAVNQIVSALPAQYETPIRVGGEVITTVSNVRFNEASSNEERSDNRE